MPVMGINAVAVISLVFVGSAVSVICPVGRMVPMGVDRVSASALHALVSNINMNAPSQSLREKIFIACTPSVVLMV